MDTIHQLIISNIQDISKPTPIFIDAMKPYNAQRCFICVDKFMANVQTNNITIAYIEAKIDNIQNSYRFNGNNIILRSNILDVFSTSSITTVAGVNLGVFNAINNKDNWLEIPIDILNNLNLSFSYINILNPVNQLLYLHLKIKFQ